MNETESIQTQTPDTLLSQSRKRFVARYVRVGAILLVIVTAVWLIAVLSAWAAGNPDYFAVSGVAVGLAYLVAWLWFIALIGVTRRRTGLVWCIVAGSARFNQLHFPPFWIGAIALIFAFDFTGIVSSLIVVVAVYIGAYGPGWLIGKLVSPRDEVEAAAYGERWSVLTEVTVRDLLLFRIPHERA
jgi:hypothetical protein